MFLFVILKNTYVKNTFILLRNLNFYAIPGCYEFYLEEFSHCFNKYFNKITIFCTTETYQVHWIISIFSVFSYLKWKIAQLIFCLLQYSCSHFFHFSLYIRESNSGLRNADPFFVSSNIETAIYCLKSFILQVIRDLNWHTLKITTLLKLQFGKNVT